MVKSRKILVWFRNDLRLHDNEMLVEAIAKSDSILPVYFFDPRHFEGNSEHQNKSGLIRTQFLIQSLYALRKSFEALNGNILILQGRPEDHIPALVQQYDIAEVYHHREVAPADTEVSANVEDRLWKLKINLKHFIGHTLYNKEDLPFPIKDIPDVFTLFKKKTERDAIIKACFPAPQEIIFAESENWGDIPTLNVLYPDTVIADLPSDLHGGEQEGLQHLDAILAAGSSIYLKGNKGPDKTMYVSRLSPWLSVGCLSPRQVYWCVKSAEERNGSNPNFNQIFLGLLWRDYYRFMFKKHGIGFIKTALDQLNELSEVSDEEILLDQWKSGMTGHTLVDALMLELNSSGFISYQGRTLVATFLIHVLKLDWTKGAIYFEEKLVDYAPASNWGNWGRIAESANEPKPKNAFDIEKTLKFLASFDLVN
ncbi:DASH family cryptochrome [Pedobacter duraquae]|uniref:Cryptochrome DASH n=1 Tax=Pedobacter duraquae TaxID=425511 RepID=A0A4R6ICG0_9SPHI|nr:DASH family cryptochrome [Pedobacter duraquae]TDO19642.1 deoxyribodipyrimidine photo-lyase [Pedobacter duraquae]